MDELYHRMKDDLEIVDDPIEPSQIHKFYIGKTIFFTGCTGFIGKLVVEKLLRTCPEIKKIYVLVRPKRNKTIEERLDEYFQNVVFDRLREENPEFRTKVIPVNGNLSDPGLGLSAEDRRRIIEETDIILHNGASVLFDLRISMSLKINVLGTKEMLDLATECRHLQVFVYVSTAYSHCYMKDIREEFYDPPADLNMVHDIIKADTENPSGMTDDAIKMILGEWPNVYTFSKATAEGVVQQYSKRVNFPCAIFRPSIVIYTWRDPIASWCGNFNGPQVIFMGMGLGLVHAAYFLDEPMDLIPADMTTNALLAVAWDAAENRRDEREVHVYNYGSSMTTPLNMRVLENIAIEPSMNYPPMKALWYYFVISTRCYIYFWVLHILFHIIPAIFADIVMIARREKPQFLSIVLKVTKHLGKLIHFTNGGWRIHVTEMKRVWEKMNQQDDVLFFNDLRNWDVIEFFKISWIGIRKYLLKDPLDTVEVANRRYKKLKIAHYTVVTLLGCLLVYGWIRFINYILN